MDNRQKIQNSYELCQAEMAILKHEQELLDGRKKNCVNKHNARLQDINNEVDEIHNV